MTMSSQSDRVTHSCDGATTEFAYTFPTTATSELEVTLVTAATGSETDLTETTHYTATSGSSGGTVTTVATYASTYEIHIRRVTPRTQTFAPVFGGDFNVDDLEAALDKITRVLVELTEDMKRTCRIRATDDEADILPIWSTRAGEWLYFDAARGLPSIATPSGFTTTSTSSTTSTSTTTSTSSSTSSTTSTTSSTSSTTSTTSSSTTSAP